ncbi:MAG: zinc ABC transporter substrate-binding protein [Anaerolineales bacterium]|nr:MAG: zinc ABC transporter substrate-binding protein [Anaerolineales bacterium]
MSTRFAVIFSLLFICTTVLGACTSDSRTDTIQQDKLKVIATTSILGDVVSNVAGELVTLSVLLPPGTDPHSYEPTPQEMAALAQADLVFANGLGLEIFLERMIQNAAGDIRVATVSSGIDLLEPVEESGQNNHSSQDEGDPHVWMDPNNVIVWAENILATLSELDPENALTYQANADNYQAALLELDAWVSQQVKNIPPENRELVTDHLVFAYYARRYELTQVGAVVPAISSIAEPSAQEVAALEDAIKLLNVRAIFFGSTVNPSLARRIAGDTRVQLVQVYTGSLSEPGGPASTYIEMMRYNTNAIVQALK